MSPRFLSVLPPLRPLIRPIAATFSLCLTCATFSVLLLWMLCGALAFSQGVLTRNLLLKDKKHGIFLVTTWDKRNTRDTKLLGQVRGRSQGLYQMRLHVILNMGMAKSS